MRIRFLAAFALAACAQPKEVTNSDTSSAPDSAEVAAPVDLERNPFDVSATVGLVSKHGLPTPSEVAQLASTANEGFDAGNCSAAIPALEEYATKANWLANLISYGLEPFYGSSRTDLPLERLRQLSAMEETSNEYKRQRNEAMVRKAECLLREGQIDQRVGMLVNTLQVISVDDHILAERARTNLYEVVEVGDSTGALRNLPG